MYSGCKKIFNTFTDGYTTFKLFKKFQPYKKLPEYKKHISKNLAPVFLTSNLFFILDTLICQWLTYENVCKACHE